MCLPSVSRYDVLDVLIVWLDVTVKKFERVLRLDDFQGSSCWSRGHRTLTPFVCWRKHSHTSSPFDKVWFDSTLFTPASTNHVILHSRLPNPTITWETPTLSQCAQQSFSTLNSNHYLLRTKRYITAAKWRWFCHKGKPPKEISQTRLPFTNMTDTNDHNKKTRKLIKRKLGTFSSFTSILSLMELYKQNNHTNKSKWSTRNAFYFIRFP